MKIRLLLVLTSCLWFANGFAQDYRPLPESNAYWIEEHGWLFPTMSCGMDYHTCTDPVYFGNDTIINSVVYHTLLYRRVCSVQHLGSPPPPPCPSGTQYYNVPPTNFTYFRQDTLARKVFIYDTLSNQDTLLYDFNLSVGNPLPHTYNNPYYPNVIVTSMDSVFLPDGYHKRYNLNIPTFSDSASIIEGIGSTLGLIAQLIAPFENFDELICFSQNNITIYHPDSSSLCDLTVGIRHREKKETFNIYPNPTNDFIHIENSFASPLSVTVLSSYGAVVYQTTFEKRMSSIDLSEWPQGIYLITAQMGKNFVSRKVVKQ